MNDPLVREILIQLIGFAVFFWILKSFAWKPILNVLDARRAKIEKGFREIDETRRELDQLKKDYEARLTKIEDEARLKIQEAVSEGKGIAQEVREKAREEANQILLKAKENINLEVAKAQVELKSKIVGLALAAAEQVLKHELDEARHKEVVGEFIDELSGEPPARNRGGEPKR